MIKKVLIALSYLVVFAWGVSIGKIKQQCTETVCLDEYDTIYCRMVEQRGDTITTLNTLIKKN